MFWLPGLHCLLFLVLAWLANYFRVGWLLVGSGCCLVAGSWLVVPGCFWVLPGWFLVGSSLFPGWVFAASCTVPRCFLVAYDCFLVGFSFVSGLVPVASWLVLVGSWLLLLASWLVCRWFLVWFPLLPGLVASGCFLVGFSSGPNQRANEQAQNKKWLAL
jgi:hypothetical protein